MHDLRLEARSIGSVEGLLSLEQCELLNSLVDAWVAETSGDVRKKSVHSAEGWSATEMMSVYEPKGRVEISELPRKIENILTGAVIENLPRIRGVLPSANGVSGWFFVEYFAEQFVAPHADCIDGEPGSDSLEIGAIGVALRFSGSGGDFVVETNADEGVLALEDGCLEGVDGRSPGFRARKRVSWTAGCEAGDALIWGGNVVHRTTPVVTGSVRKFIARIVS